MKSTDICLVLKHLEGQSSEIFRKYHDIISGYVSGQPGLYALYNKGALYYVGLATDLRGRLKTHLNDIHKNRWDTFSAYLTADDQYLRELEALLIRIAQPRGNSVRGHFPHSENLLKRLNRDATQHDREVREKILGIKRKDKIRENTQKSNRSIRHHGTGHLVKALDKIKWKSIPLVAHYKGSVYKARFLNNGAVRMGDNEYSSLSQAGEAVTGKISCNGWRFWKAQNKNGDWVFVDEFRKSGEWLGAWKKSIKPDKQVNKIVPKNSTGLSPIDNSEKISPKTGFVGETVKLEKQYKGKIYRAILCPDGRVRMGGKVYSSLSGAAVAITGHPTSGPYFWNLKERSEKSSDVDRFPPRQGEFGGKTINLSRVYKGKTYRATLRPDGKVKMGGKLYNSLSGAAVAILNRPVSGPVFWGLKKR